MTGVAAGILHFFRQVLTVFPNLIRLLLTVCTRAHRTSRRFGDKMPMDCLPIPSGVYLRPDASIYSQSYLMSLGLAVTWDNPDVTLTGTGGNIIGSHDLLPSTLYKISATIHNRSNEAPAPGMPVTFGLITFGVGGATVQQIGSDVVNLPVRGAPGEPVVASVSWTTPPVPAHYCIRIEAVWADDKNPLDNTGQHNTVIWKVRQGEALSLKIPVRNTLQGARLLTVAMHSYELPREPLVRHGMGEHVHQPRETDEALTARVVAAIRPELFPAPAAWSPALTQHRLSLEGDAEAQLEFTATVPATAPIGSRQPFHISVAEERSGLPLGGVTAIFIVQ